MASRRLADGPDATTPRLTRFSGRSRSAPLPLVQRPAQQRLDYRLPADIKPRSPLVQLAQHARGQIDIHAADGPDHGEFVGEVSGNIFTARSLLRDLVGGNPSRRFRHSSAAPLWSPST